MAIKKYRLKVGQKHFSAGSIGGGGSICYKHPQVVSLTDEQYLAFKDKFDPTEDTAAALAKKAEATTPKFSLSSAGGRKFNVINNETGAILNEEPLSKMLAQKILDEQKVN